MTDPLKRSVFAPERVTGALMVVLAVAVGWLLYPGVKETFLGTVQVDGQAWWGTLSATTAWQFTARCAVRTACRTELWDALVEALGWRRFAPPLIAMVFLAGLALACLKLQALYNAHFATLREVRALLLNRGHEFIVPLCTLRGRWVGLQQAARGLFRRAKQLSHILVVAPSQSGKTVLAKGIIASFGGTLLTVDIKGDLQRETRGCRERMSRVHTLFPTRERDDLPPRSARYDPIADLGSSPDALRAAAHLLIMDPENDSIFEQRTVPAVRAALRAAQLQNRAGVPYLIDLMREGPVAFVERLASFDDPALRDDLTTFLGRPPEYFDPEVLNSDKGFLLNTWDTLQTRLDPFKTPGLLELLEGGDLQGRALNQEVHTVYIAWPEHLLTSGARPLALILHGLITGMVREADTKGYRVPSLLMLDEAPQYRIPALPNYLATLLGRGIAVMLLIQSYAQLHVGYGDDDVTIRDNCRAKLFLQPDFETAVQLSRELGHRVVKRWRKTYSSQGVTRTLHEEKRELMTPDEITQLGPDEALLLFRGLPPVRGKRLIWYT